MGNVSRSLWLALAPLAALGGANENSAVWEDLRGVDFCHIMASIYTYGLLPAATALGLDESTIEILP